MRTLPTTQEIAELQVMNRPFSVSIYLPLIDGDTTPDSNRIAVKNMIKEADNVLQSADVSPKDINRTLRPLKQLLDDHIFWRNRQDSVALFMHTDYYQLIRIPELVTPASLSIGTGFNLKPLLQVMNDNREYYLLTLAHKNVRLYEGDRFNLTELHIKDFPKDMKEFLAIDEYPSSPETHSVAPASLGKGSEAQHEQYNVSQTDKLMLKEFFRRIDHHIHSLLTQTNKPLIIAGVAYLLPIYRQVNTYPGLVATSIRGNQGKTDMFTLRQTAWSLLRHQTAVKKSF